MNQVPGGCKIHTCELGEAKHDFELFALNNNSFIHEHLATLYFIVKEFNCKQVLEIGTGAFESTHAFAQALREIKGSMVSIDILEKQNKGLEDVCKFVTTDSLEYIWMDVIDLLFIDSNHTAKQLYNELTKYEPFVKRDGWIIIHDITNPAHKRLKTAIDKYFKYKKNYKRYRWFNNNGLEVIRKIG